MFEQHPDLLQRRIEDRQAMIRDDVRQLRSRHRTGSPRVAVGLAIIRIGERIRGELADRPLEPRSPAPRARYAR